MNKNKKGLPDQRGSARIHDPFPVSYKVISQADFEQKASYYISRRTAYRTVNMESKTNAHPMEWSSFENEEDYSPALIKIFSYLDQKLNMILFKQEEILKNLTHKHKSKDKFKTGECINISGSGVKILIDKELKKSAILELCIEPLIYPPLYVVALGKIVKLCPSSDKGKAGFETSTEFVAINGDDRDELIKYTFKRQREWITSQKRNNL